VVNSEENLFSYVLIPPHTPKSYYSTLSIPSGSTDLRFFLGLAVRYDALFDIEGIDNVLPGLEVKVKNGLMLGNVLFLDLSRTPCCSCVFVPFVSEGLATIHQIGLTECGQHVTIVTEPNSAIPDEEAHIEKVLDSLTERFGIYDEMEKWNTRVVGDAVPRHQGPRFCIRHLICQILVDLLLAIKYTVD